MLKKILFIAVFSVFVISLNAQVGQGGLKGTITDSKTGEPLPFVNVILEQNGLQKAGAATDFDGKYFIKPITPGDYTVKVKSIGFQPNQTNGVRVNAESITFFDLGLESSAVDLDVFVVQEYTVPLIDKGNTVSGGVITKEQLNRMPSRGAAGVASTVGGVFSKDDGSGNQFMRGSRSDANYYFIDGIKVRGTSALPQSSIEQVSVMMGGIPAQYGDVTGGVVSITTRGPSKDFAGGLEYVSSGYKFGDNIVGLDKYGYNLAEFSLTGPLVMKKDEEGKKTEPLVGFFLAGNGTSIIDGRPSPIGYWKAKDDVLTSIQEDPLRKNPNGPGVFYNAEYLRLNDFEKVETTPNIASNSVNINAKLDFNTGPKTNFTVGGTFNYGKNQRYSEANLLFNTGNNGENMTYTWRSYARFTQRFYSSQSNEEAKSSSIKNAFYSIQVDYQQRVVKQYDPDFKDDLFKYGHYGAFKRFTAPSYNTFGLDSSTQRFGLLQSTFEDTLTGFTPSDNNPIIANIINDYYETYGWLGYDSLGNPLKNPSLADDPTTEQENDFLRDMAALQQNGGIRNGDSPRSVYDMWSFTGSQYNQYRNVVNSQFRFTAMGSADIKDHSFTVGVEYEQRTDRDFVISPTSLWTLGRLLSNNHVNNLDVWNPTIDLGFGGERFSYDRLNSSPGKYNAALEGENQSFFDYNLRGALDMNQDGVDNIDFDNISPDKMDLSFFSAQELLNYYMPSQSYNYYGFNHYGEKLKSNPSFDDYFKERDEFGNYTRPVAAFSPIYIAGFIQDKFAFDDLVFTVGLRIDRFDANQAVLKDPWVLFETVKAGEQEALDLTDGGHPDNIGDDYVVYVDNEKEPTAILGYRNEGTWYNASGVEVDDSETSIENSTGIHPLLVDKEKTASLEIGSDAFRDFKPQNIFMPRISFSFPISDDALFFAHYDILTKRPTFGNRLNPHQYVYLESITSINVNNPNLQPERTIDYEIGFQQKLTKTSSLKLSAFYREMRDQVQLVRRTSAYPKTYDTYDNIDFGTTKGMTFTYDLRRTGNIWMKASYTLQFAEGTGSDEGTAQALIRAGKDNLRTTSALDFDQRHTIILTVDYRYSNGENYDGPVIGGKQILANTGANFVVNAGSGTPYNGQSNPTETGLGSRNSAFLDGSINGARLPWQARIDARIDRDIKIKLPVGGEKTKEFGANIYMQILNVLNQKNIVSVYRFTGNADDDGFLNAAQYSQFINSQNNTEAFADLYTMKINDPRNFSLPRRMRLGLMINF